MMALVAILVEFTVKSDAVARFRELITTNAKRSLSDEPGCQRFDVLSPADDPARIVLYEIYDDDRAFDHHLATPHYKDFAAAAEPLIETRSIKRLQFVSPAVAG
jgi:(4S)-4-hydroxy-5-phosphonooxypentane-2,3-dione isomerase